MMANQSISNLIMKCPWQDRDEFFEVYKCLFSENVLERQKGIKRVSLWESKISHLPCSVFATAAIVNVEIKDDLLNSDIPTIMSTEDLRQMYASAITRFINAVVTKACELNEGIEVRSTKAAKLVQLPIWVVNLRNAAVHNAMPTLDMLRRGAECAKQWLVKHYWEPEMCSFKDCTMLESFSKTDMQETIAKYLDTQSYLMLTPNLTQPEVIGKERELRAVLLQMEQQILQNHKAFFDTLIAPGVFLHDAVELGAFLDLANSEIVVDGMSPLPDCLTDLWMPMIVMLNKNNRMQEFLEALFKHQDQPSKTSRHIITGWCRLLMDTKMIYRTDLQDIPENERPCLSWIRLMAACMRYPTKFSAHLLPEIMEKIEALSDVKKSLLMVVVAIHAGMGVPEEYEDSPPKKRVKTDINQKNVRQAYCTNHEMWNKSFIQIAEEDIDWESTPLGAVYNRKLVEPMLEQKPIDEVGKSASKDNSIVHEDVAEFCQIKDVYSATDLTIDEDGSDDEEPVITYSFFDCNS